VYETTGPRVCLVACWPTLHLVH